MRLVVDLQGAQGSSHARGIGRYSRELAMAMAREPRDHDIVIALSGALPETAETLAASFADILPPTAIRMWHPPRGMAYVLESPQRRFGEMLRAQFLASLAPDLVHVSSLFEGITDDIVTCQPSELHRLPVVATCYDLIPLIRHSEYFGTSRPRSQTESWYYRCLYEMSLCDGLLAISASSRSEAIQHLRYPEERVFNIRTGVSADFRPTAQSAAAKAALLARYGVNDGFILFLGAGDIRKNEAGLIAAYARLPRQLRERHQLLIVGRMEPSALHRTATQLGISARNFVIVPFVPEQDLNALYSVCALFVFPSLHEGFGLPLAEAMACGAPCIASNTTSLPEVIGREDAIFDPTDPDSIAACMRKVLENPQFSAALSAHGPAQAARFTWRESAALAWNALEKIHAQHARDGTPRPSAPLARRRRLAFVSPLPPQESGIADYSADLLPHLARHYDITVVTEAEIEDVRLATAFPCLDAEGFAREAAGFDRIVYQIGNSSFHRFQIDYLLPRHPGMVVLHDAFLSGYMDWVSHENGRPEDFRAVLLHAHGYAALRYEKEMGRDAARARYPCSLPVLQGAIGVIQHSRHGVDVLARHFDPRAPEKIAIVALLRSDAARPSRAQARAALKLAEDVFVVCSFGGVADTKCPALLAEAWRLSGVTGQLVFAGGASQSWRDTLTDPAAGIRVTGRLTQAEYQAWIAAADLAVQWRTASRGETSAAVCDALAAGLPLIVNRHGSAAELPSDILLALPEDADAGELAAAILALRQDARRMATLAAAALAYARRELAPELAAQNYAEAIEQAYARPGAMVVAAALAPEARAASAAPHGMKTAAQAIARSFPSPWREGGPQRLLVDLSELARRNNGMDTHPMACALARLALETPPPGWQGRAVRLDQGRLRQTFTAPLALLGQAPLALPETPIDAGTGDILLCADINTAMTQPEYDELRRLRLSGLRIALILYDLPPDPAAGALGQWYSRMLSLADQAVCLSAAATETLRAWLAENPSIRPTSLPIETFDIDTISPANCNRILEHLCAHQSRHRAPQ